MEEKLREIGGVFQIPGQFYAYSTLVQGNINATYRVIYQKDDGTTVTYVFQKINTYVFKKPDEIMANIERVTSHIMNEHPDDVCLTFYHTADGKNYYNDTDGSFWRIMKNVDGITFDICEDLAYVRATGQAFGHFQMQLSDFDGSQLYETIPDFHNTTKRLETLFEHAEEDPCGRVKDVAEELSYIRSVADKACELSNRFTRGELPVRVTHNDTKANNVIFDRRTKKPLVVIDLDTVMPGMPMYDFGDAVRFIANTSVEDEPDTSVVFFDTAKFRAFAEGFLGEVNDSLSQDEIDGMVLGVFGITVELAARFLDDYIMGDKYFKTNYAGHNLVRTRCQLKLAKDIQKKYEELCWIVRTCVR